MEIFDIQNVHINSVNQIFDIVVFHMVEKIKNCKLENDSKIDLRNDED